MQKKNFLNNSSKNNFNDDGTRRSSRHSIPNLASHLTDDDAEGCACYDTPRHISLGCTVPVSASGFTPAVAGPRAISLPISPPRPVRIGLMRPYTWARPTAEHPHSSRISTRPLRPIVTAK